MMQSCASAAKLRAAGPIFRSASEPVRITASRHLGSSIRQCAEKPARAPNSSVAMLVPVTPFQLAGRKTTPSSVSPVVTKRQSAMSSLRASATILSPVRVIAGAILENRRDKREAELLRGQTRNSQPPIEFCCSAHERDRKSPQEIRQSGVVG